MLEGIPIGDLTAPSLLGLVVLLILGGFLIPRRVYMDKAEECKRWQQAYETSEKARALSDAQTTELLEVAKTSNAMISAIFQASQLPHPRGGDQHVAR